MDFAALPPEINSGRMYSGPGCRSLLVAAAAWSELAAELHSAAAAYASVICGLTSGVWLGPSSISMAAATKAYVSWLSSTADQATEAHVQANAAAAAYEAAHAMTVPPPMVAANRALLMSLIATNILGQNTPAIAATEALYAEMWAQDAAAMYAYAAASAAAATLTPFTGPAPTTNLAGLAGQAAAVAAAASNLAGTRSHIDLSAARRVVSEVPHALQALAVATPPLWVYTIVQSIASISVVASTVVSTCMGCIGTVNGLVAKPGAAEIAALGSPAEEVGSGAGAMASAGHGAGGAAISARLGNAVSVGAMSAPPGWGAAAPPKTPGMAALSGSGLGATPTVAEGGPGMPGIPMATSAGRSGGESTPRYGSRLTVMARPVMAG
ncbi:hypothetical protein A5787_04120 [Mycobacterium sp. 852002-50816_SCH5313054-b]|uniref:PPE family protein n=1 Tax=Mycobacterium sp. 852002-50816_SCH5313054-b TaxID=1834092 RepID=UPI000800174B|nr:PPE family protein [Mycobacterium sp. 852002-50816_SCH5313054-b]OBF54765.1 hypothetical protein A5787_04120 [Mycobacterium sp. 852002-50816_SCH5313054-b]